ncbi:MAG: hypothetical protein PQJ47_06435 [Sphaerochaetaceae bacterium]|nr:hypothetical protein [Sphaerochaetaceae bacterium]MDC7247946.1 hypothetical protein [Sphaerochaetaceae bacterium]
MNYFTTEFRCANAAIRVDVIGGPKRTEIVENSVFLNYRLAAVTVHNEPSKGKADVIWNYERPKKNISFVAQQLILDGYWEEGEINKILVSMLAMELNHVGLYPFHSSMVVYKGKGILLLGGENNHGKSMSQLEGCRRGGLMFSTETTVVDENKVAILGSKNVYIKSRAKGTERSDLPDQDEGVSKFFEKEPEYEAYNEPIKIDLIIQPSIDGHFDTKVLPMGQFEKAYQGYHSMMNFMGLNQLLSGEEGLAMPIIDNDFLRQKRAAFLADLVRDIPCYLIRSKTPQILFDEVDKILEAK